MLIQRDIGNHQYFGLLKIFTVSIFFSSQMVHRQDIFKSTPLKGWPKIQKTDLVSFCCFFLVKVSEIIFRYANVLINKIIANIIILFQ